MAIIRSRISNRLIILMKQRQLTYARYVRGGEAMSDYKALQALFFYIDARQDDSGLSFTFTASRERCFYRQSGSNPLLLETIHDASLRKTNFVVVHGGYPSPKRWVAHEQTQCAQISLRRRSHLPVN